MNKQNIEMPESTHLSNPSDELKIFELSLIWKEAEYNFAFWERLAGKLDWDQAYREALKTVLKTQCLYEYYHELMRFIALLSDGHTGVRFPPAVEDYLAELPLLTCSIGGERVITNVKRSVADKVKRWSIIRKVNGIAVAEYIEKNIFPLFWHEKPDSVDFYIDKFLRSGLPGSEVLLELESEGNIETIMLKRTKGDTNWVYGKLSTDCMELREVYKSDSHRIALTEDNIAVITIDTMMNNKLPEEFFANFSLLEKTQGYIIDIRNNGGGNSTYSDAVATVFIEGTFANQRALHPIYIGVYKAWAKWLDFGDKTYEQIVQDHGTSDWWEKSYKIPKHSYYEESISTSGAYGSPGVLKAPLVVLSSAFTASAAEDFLVELDQAKRATIIGTASFGSTGQPLTVDLESGGSFQICTRHNTYPDKREFVNYGVQPHIRVEMTLEDYKNGKDAVMEKGLAEIRVRIKAACR